MSHLIVRAYLLVHAKVPVNLTETCKMQMTVCSAFTSTIPSSLSRVISNSPTRIASSSFVIIQKSAFTNFVTGPGQCWVFRQSISECS